MALNPLGLYRLKVLGELHGQATETAFHFMTHSTSTMTTYASEAQAIVNDFKLQVLPKMQAFACQEWAAKSILIVTLIPTPGVLIEDRLASATGFQTDDSLPSFCAGLLSLRSGLSGRSGHGRIYVPGVPENLSIQSRLEGSLLGLLSDLGGILVSRYGLAGSFANARFGIYSRKLGIVYPSSNPTQPVYTHTGFMTLSSAIARPEIATVRKRKLARGI
jgi:hypothetical protein